jgi:hypothetical protein
MLVREFGHMQFQLFIVELYQVLSMKQINPMIIICNSSLIYEEPLLSDAVTDLIWNFALIGIHGDIKLNKMDSLTWYSPSVVKKQKETNLWYCKC